jgi:hydrogenase-4 component E
MAMALFGFLVLSTRRHAVSQLIGFLLLDNGIATVAFLTAGGVPLVVELGVSLDVLLVVLILRVLTSRIRTEYGDADLDDMTELRD